MKMKRILSAILVVCMMLGVLTACGGNTAENGGANQNAGSNAGSEGSENVTPVGEYPIVNEPITITFTGVSNGAIPENNLFFQRWSETSGITLEFDFYDTWNDQKGLVFAGSEYGDIILNGLTISDEEMYGPQGQLLDLTDLIENYAPNIKKVFEEHPEIKAGCTATDGAIYSLPYIFYTATTQPMIAYFNGTWMENVGITKVPETTDELYELLKAIKEQDANGNGDPNDEIPLTSCGLTSIWDVICTAFTGMPDANANGLSYNVDDNGNVIFVPTMDEYKEFLKYGNKLYSEGLVDPEFATQSADQLRAKTQGMQACFYSGSPTVCDPSTTDKQLSLSPLTSPTNDKKVCAPSLSYYTGCAAITDNCEDPVAAIRLLDMLYATPETAENEVCLQSAFFGFENQHWKYTDDSKEYYEWIAPVTGFGDIRTQAIGTGNFPGYLNMMATPKGNSLMEQKCEQTELMQRPYEDSTNVYPANVRLSGSDGERATILETDLFTYVNTTAVKFIMGELDIDAEWDNFQSTMEKYGLSELLEIKQAALEQYNQAIA